MRLQIPDDFLDKMAVKFHMLGDRTRLSIVRALLSGERNVSDVVEETGQHQANVSKHLKLLADAGMVLRRKDGLMVYYRLSDPLVERLCSLVCGTIVEESKAIVKQKGLLLKHWNGR